MRKIVIFEKYEVNEIGEVSNMNTGNKLKIETTNTGRFAKLSIDGKTKRINIDKLIEENFPPIIDESAKTRRQSKKYIVKIEELNGTIHEFKTFKEANDHYGLRKDYLNYCISEKFAHMLTKGNLQLKSVEKISLT